MKPICAVVEQASWRFTSALDQRHGRAGEGVNSAPRTKIAVIANGTASTTGANRASKDSRRASDQASVPCMKAETGVGAVIE